jgi:hypothetical protein
VSVSKASAVSDPRLACQGRSATPRAGQLREKNVVSIFMKQADTNGPVWQTITGLVGSSAQG